MKYNLSLFIFRRDLRQEDNTALIKALKQSDSVLPIFIFTPTQIGDDNPYKSNRLVQFMIESLLDIPIPIQFFFGEVHSILEKLFQKIKTIQAVFVNADYTPYSIARDKAMEKLCKKNGIAFHSFEDSLLLPVASIRTKTGGIYKKFTPYYHSASIQKVREPVLLNTHLLQKFYSKKDRVFCKEGNLSSCKENRSLSKKELHTLYKKEKGNAVKGGRSNALAILEDVSSFENYPNERNDLSYTTTKLSAYNKFGCVSIREVYYAFEKLKDDARINLQRGLWWRDFYYNILFENPYVLQQKNYNPSYDKLEDKGVWLTWETASPSQKKLFERWCEGFTGFPIVDAGMREMNETGFMHNRARLIVASFLTKLMMWHWKDGEKYFAEKLIDYDPAQNNGNWQWCAGSGVDAQPYYRIFNPWTQFSTHDKNGEYVRKWLPECKDIPLKDLMKWDTSYTKYKNSVYPKPMLDYAKKREESLKKLAGAFRN